MRLKSNVAKQKDKKKCISTRDPNTPLMCRGYKEVQDRLMKAPKFSMCCGNCNSYYKKDTDTEECCQDSNVLEFDMVIEENRIYCLRWKPVSDEEVVNNPYEY